MALRVPFPRAVVSTMDTEFRSINMRELERQEDINSKGKGLLVARVVLLTRCLGGDIIEISKAARTDMVLRAIIDSVITTTANYLQDSSLINRGTLLKERLNISNTNTSRACISSNSSNRHLLKSITICIDNITNRLFHLQASQYRLTLCLNNSIHRIKTC